MCGAQPGQRSALHAFSFLREWPRRPVSHSGLSVPMMKKRAGCAARSSAYSSQLLLWTSSGQCHRTWVGWMCTASGGSPGARLLPSFDHRRTQRQRDRGPLRDVYVWSPSCRSDVGRTGRLLAHFLETHIESWIPGWVAAGVVDCFYSSSFLYH